MSSPAPQPSRLLRRWLQSQSSASQALWQQAHGRTQRANLVSPLPPVTPPPAPASAGVPAVLPADEAIVPSQLTEPVVSQAEQLAILDQVVTEIEQSRAAVASAPVPAPIPTSVPVVAAPPEPAMQVDQPVAGVAAAPEPQVSVLDQALPQVVASLPTPAQLAPGGRAGAKESLAKAPVEQPTEFAMATPAETEPEPEIPPEVSEYLQHVQDHQNEVPQEVVIGPDQQLQLGTVPLAQPVVILPLTPDVEQQGAHKSPQFSVRWLVEWSRKIMRMFDGKVIYHQGKSG